MWSLQKYHGKRRTLADAIPPPDAARELAEIARQGPVETHVRPLALLLRD